MWGKVYSSSPVYFYGLDDKVHGSTFSDGLIYKLKIDFLC